MTKILKMKTIGLSKLNNSEYANFSTRFTTLVGTATPLALGIAEADLTAYQADLDLLGDLIAQSRISDQTARLAELEKERDGLLDYLFGLIKASHTAPVAAQRSAAVALTNVTKPYIGIQHLPNQQETVQILGLQRDLSKEENAPHCRTLNLTDTLEALDSANGAYASLIDERNISNADSRLEDSKTVRARMTILYDTMSNIAYAQNIIKPTAATIDFINHLNSLIDEINALYNLRMSQTGAAEEKK